MLQAILLNKAGRNITNDAIDWRQLFKTSEDSLTSTIFGRLNYLPNDLIWQILLQSCYKCTIENTKNRIESMEFWPRWDSNNTDNVNHVEPDVFIRSFDFDLIIEAKRWDDYSQQSKQQWKKEFQSYLNQYKGECKKVYLIAIGGKNEIHSEDIQIGEISLTIFKSSWSRILNEIKEVKTTIEKNQIGIEKDNSLSNILNDIILAFGIHGYTTGEWFENTDFCFGINDSSLSLFSASFLDFKKNNYDKKRI